MDRKDFLERARTPEERILLARVLDIIETVKKTHLVQVTDFFDPYQQSLLQHLVKSPGTAFLWTGGYEEAERRRLVVCPDYLEPGEQDPETDLLLITGNLKFQTLSHRDYLGAVMSLGIKREKTGDLILLPDGCQLLADRSVSGYIAGNLDKVGRVGVRVEIHSGGDVFLPERQVREVFATVPSLRLDAVASAGYGLSRTKMGAEIAAEKVRVNWMPVSDGSYAVREGDRLSIRGLGRVDVEKVKGETKKGRIALILRRYS